jgi:NAD(P)-dependent dehydrogenase (short-subunit alcohol dehydrogenase family)
MNVRQLFDLAGRVALVTGGSRGLGLQIAQALGEMGAKVAITARKANELDEARATLAAAGIDCRAYACDLGKTDAALPLVEGVLKDFSRIDVLVNNAGATWGAPTVDYPLEAWNKVITLNNTAAFLVAQAVGKLAMIPARYGKIVNVASIAGLIGHLPDEMSTIAYNTSKGGLISFTRALAGEWGVHGITVNAIAPGFFPTRMARGAIERFGDQVIAHTPLGKLGGDDDLKGLAVLLASDASRHITGQVIAVDGGVSIV